MLSRTTLETMPATNLLQFHAAMVGALAKRDEQTAALREEVARKQAQLDHIDTIYAEIEEQIEDSRAALLAMGYSDAQLDDSCEIVNEAVADLVRQGQDAHTHEDADDEERRPIPPDRHVRQNGNDQDASRTRIGRDRNNADARDPGIEDPTHDDAPAKPPQRGAEPAAPTAAGAVRRRRPQDPAMPEARMPQHPDDAGETRQPALHDHRTWSAEAGVRTPTAHDDPARARDVYSEIIEQMGGGHVPPPTPHVDDRARAPHPVRQRERTHDARATGDQADGAGPALEARRPASSMRDHDGQDRGHDRQPSLRHEPQEDEDAPQGGEGYGIFGPSGFDTSDVTYGDSVAG